MTEVEQLLARQTEWQKSRRSLTWPEKIRQAERVRESILLLRTPRRHTQVAEDSGRAAP